MAAPLETFFASAWAYFLDGSGIPGEELGDDIANAGLAEWRLATPQEILDSDALQPGDDVLALTDAGRAAIAGSLS